MLTLPTPPMALPVSTQTAAATTSVASAMGTATTTMANMSKVMNPQKMNQQMQQFAKENAKLGEPAGCEACTSLHELHGRGRAVGARWFTWGARPEVQVLHSVRLRPPCVCVFHRKSLARRDA